VHFPYPNLHGPLSFSHSILFAHAVFFRIFFRSLQGTRSCKKQAQKQVSDEQSRLTWRLNGIQKKKDRLVEAHVHEQTVDAKTFREHMDRLRRLADDAHGRSPSQSVRNATTWFQLGIIGDAPNSTPRPRRFPWYQTAAD
jgi:hypothetical protein